MVTISAFNIYWIDVLDNMKSVCCITTFIGFAIWALASLTAMFNSDVPKIHKQAHDIATTAFILTLIATIGYVFIPQKTTMLEILLAKNIRVDQTRWTPQLIRETADYVAKAFSSVGK